MTKDRMSFELGSPADIHLALAPLAEVSTTIAESLITEGKGNACGECGKPFTATRQREGVIRLVTGSVAGLAMSCYLICGSCRIAAATRLREGKSAATDDWCT